MAATRRIGKESSKSRARLLDAAEQLMLDEGYAAVTSRRVATAADVKAALVHYYFPTMDDLFVAMFRRGAERNMQRLTRAAESKQPLRSLWRIIKEQRGSVLWVEFTALSRRRSAVRAELAAFGRRFRELQLDTLTRVLDDHGIDRSVVTAEAISLLMTGLSTTLTLEREVGLTVGHTQALALMEQLLERYEPAGGMRTQQ
jgi:AcrR family transcriptional regulator